VGLDLTAIAFGTGVANRQETAKIKLSKKLDKLSKKYDNIKYRKGKKRARGKARTDLAEAAEQAQKQTPPDGTPHQERQPKGKPTGKTAGAR
jgi:hypothetical protein